MTLFTDPHVHKIVAFGFNLVYPRNHFISAAASFAAWYGRNWSITRIPCILPPIMSRFISDGIVGVIDENLGLRNFTRTWSDTFTDYFILPYWYVDYVVPYYPYIHNTISISAAVVVSITLNLLAQAFFGIRSDKQKQNEPIATALGVPNIPQPIQNIITTANLDARSQTSSVMNQISTQSPNEHDERMLSGTSNTPQIPQSNNVTVNPSTHPQPTPVSDRSVVQPVNNHTEIRSSMEPATEVKIKPITAESSQEPPSKPELISPTTEPSKESKELLFDIEEYRKFAKEQTCCWNPLKILKITIC